MFFKVFYTDRLIPDRFAGTTFGPFVFIRPNYKNDAGLLNHELTHVKQFWKNPLMVLLYQFSKTYRLRYEAEAYKTQLEYAPGRLDLFAGYLVNNYNLQITLDQARQAILSAE
jgi:hypothetical protein